MEIATFFGMFLGYFISAIPALVFWIAVVVFVTVRLRPGGGRAERFLIIGAVLEIISSLVRIPTIAIIPWLIGKGYSMDYAFSLLSGYGIFSNVVGMAGVICFIYAFWVKFKTNSYNIVESVNEEQIKEVAA